MGIVFGAGFNRARPPGDGRDANAALGQIALDTTQFAVGIKVVRLVSTPLVRAIVGSKEDQRALVDLQFPEQIQDTARVTINVPDHRRKTLLRFRPVLGREFAQVGHLHASVPRLIIGVGHVHREVEEE